MAELSPESLSRRRRIGASIATGTVLVLALLLLRECGPCGPEPSGPTGAGPAVSAGPPGAGAPPLAAGTPSGVGAAPPGGGEVARVETLLGTATAGPPGGAPRGLACGDAVFRGEVVSTAPESRVGLMRGDVYAQLGSSSAVGMDLTTAGALDVDLQAGEVRVVDARTEGPPVRVSVHGVTAELVGGDADVYRPAGGGGARICTHGRPLSIAGTGGSATASPNQCVGAAPDAPLAAAAAPPMRLALPQSAAEECYDLRVATAAFTPDYVARGPDDWLFPAWNPDRLERDACDDPGSGCNADLLSNGGDKPSKKSSKKPSLKASKKPSVKKPSLKASKKPSVKKPSLKASKKPSVKKPSLKKVRKLLRKALMPKASGKKPSLKKLRKLLRKALMPKASVKKASLKKVRKVVRKALEPARNAKSK